MPTATVVLLYYQVRMIVRVRYTDAVTVHVISADVYRTDQHYCIYPVSLLGTHPFHDIDVARLVYIMAATTLS